MFDRAFTYVYNGKNYEENIINVIVLKRASGWCELVTKALIPILEFVPKGCT